MSPIIKLLGPAVSVELRGANKCFDRVRRNLDMSCKVTTTHPDAETPRVTIREHSSVKGERKREYRIQDLARPSIFINEHGTEPWQVAIGSLEDAEEYLSGLFRAYSFGLIQDHTILKLEKP